MTLSSQRQSTTGAEVCPQTTGNKHLLTQTRPWGFWPQTTSMGVLLQTRGWRGHTIEMVTQGEEEHLDIHQNREGLLETYIRAVKEDIWQHKTPAPEETISIKPKHHWDCSYCCIAINCNTIPSYTTVIARNFRRESGCLGIHQITF